MSLLLIQKKMSSQAEHSIEKSVKQKLLEASTPFRINTERSSSKRYYYQPTNGLIVDSDGDNIGEVLEINQYSIKLRVSILGQYEAMWCRFETFIFDNK
jgi:hypothetical protein